MKLHPVSERLVSYIQDKAQIENRMFYRVMVAYYLTTMASTMRAVIVGYDANKTIPINTYAMALSPSGSGKGVASNIMEQEILKKFHNRFEYKTFTEHQMGNLEKIAEHRCKVNGTTFDEEMNSIVKEVEQSGKYVSSFESGTPAAIKQFRHRLKLAGCGSVNYIVDEIGSNLIRNSDVTTTFLDVYDLGLDKERLTKSTSENKRFQKIDAAVPANMLLFGTPSALFDGGNTEETFFKILEEGFARRCLFAFSKSPTKVTDLSPEEVVDLMLSADKTSSVEDLEQEFSYLGDINNLNREILIERQEMIKLITYRQECERKSRDYSEHDILKKLEMEHRYFKALKLAGAYAFVDGHYAITEDHLDYAINLVELSGNAFHELIKVDKPYMRLANYFAEKEGEVTFADLIQELPYFKGSKQQKEEMLSLAIAYGYRNNIIIKKSIEDGIHFFSGQSLETTDIDKLEITISDHLAEGYQKNIIPWNRLSRLGKTNDYHWCNHEFEDGHRKEDNVIPGFNVIALDVDSGFPLKAAVKAFEGVSAIFYTTKSSKPEFERYRIILPISHKLYMDKAEYKEFMNEIMDSMPFECDYSANQRSRKWQTNDGDVVIVQGDLFDVLPYIPKTKKADDRKVLTESMDLDRLEMWIINNTGDGNRNKQLYNYACILADMGKDVVDIRKKVLSLNEKLADKLSEDEIANTILKSIVNKVNI